MIPEEAVYDIRYLLDRGYSRKSAVKYVCDHYRFDEKMRHILSRVVFSRAVSEARRSKFLNCEELTDREIVIDGYNIIIGMESILEKQAYLCDDGVVRDTKGTFRSFRRTGNTDRAVEIIFLFLREINPSSVFFLFDSQISKSGLFAKMIREKINDSGIKGDALTSKHVDYDLKNSRHVVASSDGVIIDSASMVVNFLSCIVSRFKELDSGIIRIDGSIT